MTYTLVGMSSLGTVQTEENNKDAQLFQMPLPTKDSVDAVILDLFGMMRTIIITGTFTGDAASQTAFIEELDALANGSQVGRNYHSDKGYGSDGAGNYKVLISSTRWKVEEGGINKIEYTINMMESKT